MQSIFQLVLLALAVATGTQAAPAESDTVILWNGSENISTTVARSLSPAEGALDGRSINCKGSGLCKLSVKSGDCQTAFSYLQDKNVYKQGGSQSGTCSGHCGVFVQSQNGSGGCSRKGSEMKNSFNAIRNNNCKKCGSDEYSSNCEVTINYVSKC